jgi:hypothetical protein
LNISAGALASEAGTSEFQVAPYIPPRLSFRTPSLSPLVYRFFTAAAGALFGVGNECFEARIAVKRFEIGVLFHVECGGWS